MTYIERMETAIKTPMQLLFYRIEQLRFANNPIDEIIKLKHEMLEMEKQQIIKGVDFGTNQWDGWDSLNGEQYYEQTYGGNK